MLQTLPPPESLTHDSFEGFLKTLEGQVRNSGYLLVLLDGRLRLDVMLLRHEKNPRVYWGLKPHQDWAVKATLLRFASGQEPVHVLLSQELDGSYDVVGWLLKRAEGRFWARSILPAQAQSHWEHCVAPASSDRYV
ncbi:hypothetical protein [Geothrix sp. 21YS21S-4]|uniref:hypothetical protein n=1 Tax=Geothrix sp. 21YS21S-4 TaxID=3068889 RepID=UPI0027B8CAA6|nr:hypothetical protein [Geothrix sp. 21YS21S-4]